MQREKNIIEGFKNKIFRIHHDDEDSRFENNDENDIRDNNGLIDYIKLESLIKIKERHQWSISQKTFSSSGSESIAGKIEQIKK